MYETIFTPDLNGAQAVIAALVLRRAENRRKRPPQDAPDFLPYASRFAAMLMGRYVLDALGIGLERLDHRNFATARDFIESESTAWLGRAEDAIEQAIAQLFNGRDRTWQRLSATFRRADLVETLLGQERSQT